MYYVLVRYAILFLDWYYNWGFRLLNDNPAMQFHNLEKLLLLLTEIHNVYNIVKKYRHNASNK